MKRMIKKEYFYKTEEEMLTIWKFLNALYGHLYCSGFGNIKIDEENKIVCTNLLLSDREYEREVRIAKELEEVRIVNGIGKDEQIRISF